MERRSEQSWRGCGPANPLGFDKPEMGSFDIWGVGGDFQGALCLGIPQVTPIRLLNSTAWDWTYNFSSVKPPWNPSFCSGWGNYPPPPPGPEPPALSAHLGRDGCLQAGSPASPGSVPPASPSACACKNFLNEKVIWARRRGRGRGRKKERMGGSILNIYILDPGF